ncbi:MAG: FGGY-family carbohydrate kinase [Devosia sp.]|nr:FGGY-family carbohydrate kinase [Devosia sp.]
MPSAPDIVIGLDIGTTSTMGVAVRMPDEILAVARRPVTLTSLKPGWAEEDPEEWWANTVDILREIAAAVEPRALAGICVTGMLPAVVLLDAEGRLLRPSIQQSDGRCVEQVEELRRDYDETAFLKRTGNGINQQLVGAKLRWIAANEPEVFGRIATVFGSYDYINWRLTGVRAVEQNWALEAGFTDLATNAIADDLVALAGIPRSAVPPRSVSHQRMGAISAEAAALTGLPEGLPVFGGAADHIVSALAAGISRSGDVLLKFGGAGDIIVASDRAVPDKRLYLDYHLIPGLYAPNGCMASSGTALNWLTTILQTASGTNNPHQALDALADQVAPGADGLVCLPYFLGEKTPIHDPLARGAFVGLSLLHTPAHIWRATLEAVAFGFRHHIDVLADMGHRPQRFMASDGGTASRVWMQIMADVLGKPVQLLENHYGSAVGAAFVAAIGAGLSSDWGDVARLSRYGEEMQPSADRHAAYNRVYGNYRQLYEILVPYFHATTRV